MDSWRERKKTLGALGLAVVAAALIRSFLVQAFAISTGSMEDTLRPGDLILVDKLTTRLRAPALGELLAFHFPSDDPAELHCTGPMAGKDFLKRVVGVGGDVIELRDGALYRSGSAVGAEPYVKDLSPMPCAKPPASLPPAAYQRAWEERRIEQEMGEGLRDHFGPVTVPPGAYFVLGDNRDASCDSRFWGPVPARSVKGVGRLVYWPPARIGPVR
ncbi:MAG: signal peptidase I [Elusimicrobia bacterium]|nr:signal peptidase I [Elusimicrobiota bacterium]